MTPLFEALCRASVFGLAALFVALIAQFALGRRAPAAWRAWIWRIALLQSAFALLPLAPVRWEVLAPLTPATSKTIVAPLVRSDEFSVADNWNTPPLEIPGAASTESAPPVPDTAPITESAPPILDAPPMGSASLIPIAKTPAPFDWRALVLAIYALGIAFHCAQLLRGQRQLRRALRGCALAENAALTARLNVLAARIHLKTAPQLLVSEGGSPFLTGITRPRIVLPRTLCDAESAQLDAILAHELAHLKRRDLVWLGATWLLQTLLWFHPLAPATRRFHGLETECACDELALRLAPIAPQSYGALLLNSMNNSKFSSPLAAGTCDTLFALKTRLLRLNNAPKSPRVMAKLAFAAALLVSCVAVVPLKLVARAQNAPADSPGAPVGWPAGRITKPQYDARAVVQGVVISRTTRKPLAGVPIILVAPYRSKGKIDMTRPSILRYQGTVTDARGYYRFNTIGGGRHSLEIAGVVFNNAEFSGSSAELRYEFNLKNGRLRSFKTAIDEDFARPNRDRSMVQIYEVAGRGSAVVQGIVKSKRTGKPLASVPMVLAYGKTSWQAVTDARGYFHFNARPGRYVLRPKNGAPFETFDLAKGQKREFDFTLDELPARDVADVAVVPSASKKAGSAVVQGVVTLKRTGKPLAGVPMVLIPKLPKQKSAHKVNSTPNLRANQETVTDMRGYFRFNAASGEFLLLADAQIEETQGSVATRAKTMTVVTGKEIAVLTAKQGQKQQFNFALDKTNRSRISIQAPETKSTGNAVTQGVVTSKQTGKPLAGVPILVMAGNARRTPKQGALAEISTPQKTVTDARGYFRFNVAGGVHSLLIDAKILDAPGKMTVDAPRRMTVFVAQQVYVVPLGKTEMRNFRFELDEKRATADKAATAPVAATNAASASGQIVDENKRPLAGATVHLHGSLNGESPMGMDTKTDANGRFRFENLQPGTKITLTSALKGYGIYPQKAYVVERDKNADFVIEMHRVTMLHGIVIDEAGRPASDFVVFASGADMSTVTNKIGRFFLPKVLSGSVNVDVWHKPDGELWGPFKVQGGDQNVKIRLTKSTSNARSPFQRFNKPLTPKTISDKTRALIGKTAPEIQALHWANGKAAPLSSLRGKIVLLAFEIFDSNEKSVLNNLARSLRGRVQIVGVEANVPQIKIPHRRLDEIAAQFSFPIALDTAHADSKKLELGGQTFSAYGLGGRGYAVVGRDGKILYAGGSLKIAVQIASR